MGPTEKDWLSTYLDKLEKDIGRLDGKIDTLAKYIQDNLVLKAEIWPIKAILYPLVGAILLAFVGLLILKVGWK